MSEPGSPAGPRLPWLPIGGLTLLALLLLGLALTYPLSHDEQQYVAGAALIFDAQIYRDFLYIQTPYWALILGAAIEATGDQPFLVARLVNWLVSTGCVVVLYLLARLVGAPRYLALGAAALFTSSSVMQFSFGTARNDMLPCLFTLLGFYWFVRASAAQRRSVQIQLFAAGIMFAAAVGTKVSFAFVPAAFVAFSLARQWRERDPRYWSSELLPLVAGGIAGAVPMIVLALPSLENFWYGVVQYHSTATLEWYTPYSSERLRLPYQLQLFVRLFLRSDATLAASIWLGATIGVLSISPMRQGFGVARGIYLLPLLLLLVGVPFAFIPKPSWVQYFGPLVPFVILAPIYLWHLLPESDARRYTPVAIAVIAFGSLYGLGNLAADGVRALRSDNWTSASVRRLSSEIDAALGSRSGTIITLAPIYVLESGRPIASELAVGPQFFRTGDLEDPATIRRLRAVSPATLEPLLERDPPAAILVGVETVDRYRDVEAPLREYAIAHGYTPVALTGPPEATLFVAPSLGDRDR